MGEKVEPVTLDAWDVDELDAMTIHRRPLPDDPLKEWKGKLYLFSDHLRPFYDAVLRVALSPAPRWERKTAQGNEFVRLDDSQARAFRGVWSDLPRVLVIQDLAPVSVAIGLNRREPGGPRTQVGELVYQAKYQGSAKALERLCRLAAETAQGLLVFHRVRHVVPVPASRARRGNAVPEAVARAIAEALSATFSPEIARTVVDRKSLKSVARGAKARALQGTIAVSEVGVFDPVLLVDDSYQSGTSMNYTVKALEQVNPFVRVYGFSCAKTLSNRDNIGSSSGGKR